MNPSGRNRNRRRRRPGRLEVGERRMDSGNLANGGKPAPLPFDGADLLTTSTEFLDLEELPERLVFMGGGFISMEFATLLSEPAPT